MHGELFLFYEFSCCWLFRCVNFLLFSCPSFCFIRLFTVFSLYPFIQRVLGMYFFSSSKCSSLSRTVYIRWVMELKGTIFDPMNDLIGMVRWLWVAFLWMSNSTFLCLFIILTSKNDRLWSTSVFIVKAIFLWMLLRFVNTEIASYLVTTARTSSTTQKKEGIFLPFPPSLLFFW